MKNKEFEVTLKVQTCGEYCALGEECCDFFDGLKGDPLCELFWGQCLEDTGYVYEDYTVYKRLPECLEKYRDDREVIDEVEKDM